MRRTRRVPVIDAPLVLRSVHQRDAGLDARERAARAVEGLTPGRDAFAITSCHRVEVYALGDGGVTPAFDALFTNRLRGDEPVAHHLFRVACGLDSVVVGERQILGQLRRAHDAARSGTTLRAELSELIRRALHLGRRARARGLLGSSRSIGSLAVDELARRIEAPRERRVLIVGAGEIGTLAARALSTRVGHVVVANRDRARAEALASRIGGTSLDVADLDAGLARADAVISAADTRGRLLVRERLTRRLERGPLLIVDVAVPRSVADDARELRGLTYLTVDDLRDGHTPPADVAAVERLCAEQAAAFAAWRREREAAPAIRALRERAEAIRRVRVERALAKLRHLGERDRRVVEAFSTALVNELLHEPTLALRRGQR